ncbi:MAG: hypothetical protein GX318_05225 [Clostridia bacterium]|nr:hypothetical protein [Clostridia bacterium]
MAEVVSIGDILAVVALKEVKTKVGGGVPIFIVEDIEEQEKIAMILGKILNAMVHNLENGMYIVTRH